LLHSRHDIHPFPSRRESISHHGWPSRPVGAGEVPSEPGPGKFAASVVIVGQNFWHFRQHLALCCGTGGAGNAGGSGSFLTRIAMWSRRIGMRPRHGTEF
jgi:hypothetical protein